MHFKPPYFSSSLVSHHPKILALSSPLRFLSFLHSLHPYLLTPPWVKRTFNISLRLPSSSTLPPHLFFLSSTASSLLLFLSYLISSFKHLACFFNVIDQPNFLFCLCYSTNTIVLQIKHQFFYYLLFFLYSPFLSEVKKLNVVNS